MRAQLLAVEAGHEVRGRAHADERLEGQGPDLPALGHGVGRGAQLVGRQLGQQLGARPQDPDVGPEPLVGRARQRVAAQRRDVEGAVRGGVHGVDEDARARCVGGFDDPRQVGDGADGVAGGGDRHPARAPREHRFHRGGGQLERLALGIGEAHLGARAPGRDEPGRDVGVVVQAGETISSPGCSVRHAAAEKRMVSAVIDGPKTTPSGSAPSRRATEARASVDQRVGALGGLEGAAVVRGVARAHPVRHLLDGVVDHLGAGGAVEARPAVAQTGEAGAVHGSGP